MNWEALGAIAELLGAVAVVVSLLYVATQVRESTRQARRDASRDLATRISDVSLAVSTNPDLGDLLMRGGSDPTQLQPGDQVRFRGLMNALFRSLEQQFLLRKEGALDDERWDAVQQITKDFATLPGVKVYLMDRGHWYTKGFMSFVWGINGGRPEGDGTNIVEHYVDPAE